MSQDPKSQGRNYRWLLPAAAIAIVLAAAAPFLYDTFFRPPHARPTSRSVVNLDGLYNWMYAWANDHNGRFPDKFGTQIDQKREGYNTFPLDFRLLINPRLSDSAWPPPPRSASVQQFIHWANSNAHYVLITPNQGLEHPDDQLLMYERPHPSLEDGINICFGDGHVKFFRWPRAVELLKQAGEPVPDWARQRAQEMDPNRHANY